MHGEILLALVANSTNQPAIIGAASHPISPIPIRKFQGQAKDKDGDAVLHELQAW